MSGRLRVASLLPSATEICCFVGGANQLIGRSHECDFPSSVQTAPILTSAFTHFENSRQMHEAVCTSLSKGEGLYAIDTDVLSKLRPDVILTQSLCNVCSVDVRVVNRVASTLDPVPVVVSMNPFSLEEVITDCLLVGSSIGREEEAKAAAEGLRERMRKLAEYVKSKAKVEHPKVGFMEWVDPIFVGGHWTPEIIELAGGTHVLNPPGKPSMAVTNEDFAASDPDWIVICPCGLDIAATLREAKVLAQQQWWCNLRAVREGRVVVVDGNQMFNRPGPRLVDALEWLAGLLHGEEAVMPEGFPWRRWDGLTVEGHEAQEHRKNTQAPETCDPTDTPTSCSSSVTHPGAPTSWPPHLDYPPPALV